MPNLAVTNYIYAQPPASDDPTTNLLHQFAENRKISRAIQSIAAVVQHQGTTLASASYGQTGVTPGTYTNPAITVAVDGRVTRITSGDSPIPKGGLSGQFLASDGNGGLSWRYGSSSSGGGGGGSSSTTIQGPKPAESADLAVTTAGQTFSLSLKPTGVTPGSYTGANLTVDQSGRITAITSGPDLRPSISALQTQVAALLSQVSALQAAAAVTPVHDVEYWRDPSNTIWSVTMSVAGSLVYSVQTAKDAVTAQDGLTMISTEDGSEYIAY